MGPFSVVVLPEVCEFPLLVISIPKEGVIKIFTANSSDESLNEGVRYPGRVEDWRGNSLGDPLSVSGVSSFVPV